ncbi:MAG: archease [bacterium]|nr:archease [bacterium]
MFETFEHTADLGLRVVAPDLAGLMVEAARGLMAVMVENPARIQPRRELNFRLAGCNSDELLLDWLAELLFRLQSEHLVFSDFRVRLTPGGLEARAGGEPFSPARHGAGVDVKAVTYHGLRVERTPEGWLAEVVLDL